MKHFVLFLLIHLHFVLSGQNIYYKNRNSSIDNDSIVKSIDRNHKTRITYHKSSYWASRSDTTDSPSSYNSYFNFYSDSINREFVIVSNDYYISNPIQITTTALPFLKFNWPTIYSTKFRPDQTDCYIDSSILEDYLRRYPKMDMNTAVKLSTDCPLATDVSDGIGIKIEIQLSDTVYSIGFNEQIFEPSDHWYMYNSKLPLMTLKLLLDNDRAAVLNNIRIEEMNDTNRLSKSECETWTNRMINKRIREFKSYRRNIRKGK